MPAILCFIVRALPLRNIRAQTGLIFFAGLLSLVVITIAVSVIAGNAIREDDARLAGLAETSIESGQSPADIASEIAVINQRRDGNIGMIRGMYGALFVSSLVFLLIGLWFVQQIVVAPVEALDEMAQRIAAGDLETPTTLGGSSEFQDLSHSFEVMRLELRAAATRQAEWAAQLEERVAERTQELAALHQEMRQQAQRVAALQERERIGMELHDGLLQTLSYLYLKTDRAEELAAKSGTGELALELSLHRRVLEQASQEVRHFIADLHELPPPPASLGDALSRMIADLNTTPAAGDFPQVSLESSGSVVLPADWVTHLTRITREAFINAVQHGHAARVVISCCCEDGCGELRIADDGLGFNPGAPCTDGRPHFGLSVMQARAARIGATFAIDSTRSGGTSVTVRWRRPESEKLEV